MKSTPAGRAAARVHARAPEAGCGHVVAAEAQRELLGLVGAVVVLAWRRRCARSGRSGRAADTWAGRARRGLDDRDLGIARAPSRPAARSPARPRAMPPGRPLSTTATSGVIVPGPSVRSSSSRPCTDCDCEGRPLLDPGVSESSGAGSAQSTRKPPVTPATSAGRRMIVSAMRAQTPAVALGAETDQRHAQAQQARAEDRQQRGEQRQRGGDRDERDEQPADAHRADERQRDQHEAGQPDRDRRAGEEHRVAGRAHRRAQRLASVGAAEQLLAEAVDDEQRVVDRDRDADQRDEIGDVDRHVHLVRQQPQQPERDRHRAGGHQQRHERRRQRAEHDQQHEDRDRDRDRLAAPQIGVEDRLQIVVDRDLAADVHPPPRRAARLRAASARRAAAPPAARGACRSARTPGRAPRAAAARRARRAARSRRASAPPPALPVPCRPRTRSCSRSRGAARSDRRAARARARSRCRAGRSGSRAGR